MFRRKIVALAVALVLALPWCATAARQGAEPRNTTVQIPSAPLAGFWSWLRGVWTKGGCGIDPGGKPACAAPAAPTSNADIGCTIDPGGRPCGG